MSIDKIILPSEKGTTTRSLTNRQNRIVCIGANGSGKSRLAYWIETNQGTDVFVHRISAQRSLEFPTYLFQENVANAKNELFYGTSNQRQLQAKNKPAKHRRWGANPVNPLLMDFDNLVSYLLADHNNKQISLLSKIRKSGSLPEEIEETILETAISIWNDIFNKHRIMKLKDEITGNDFIDVTDEFNMIYPPQELSDGERMVFYFIGQCLCIPSNSIIIIDEPETHLHKTITNRLWTLIEDRRKDCLFIYFTHDMDFFFSKNNSIKIWIKSYTKNKWEMEFIDSDNFRISSLNDKLAFQILGSRQKVLFVEGEINSLDREIYAALYLDWYVVPCGGCNEVITTVRGLSSKKEFHHISAAGIIDRDIRTSGEISDLNKKNIFISQLAIIENILLLPCVILSIKNVSGIKDNDDIFIDNLRQQIINKIRSRKKFWISETFNKRIYNLIALPSSRIDKCVDYWDDHLTKTIHRSKEEYLKIEKEFDDIINSGDLYQLLGIYNMKDLASIPASALGFKKERYQDMVLLQLKNNTSLRSDVLQRIGEIPREIPRTPDQIPPSPS